MYYQLMPSVLYSVFEQDFLLLRLCQYCSFVLIVAQ